MYINNRFLIIFLLYIRISNAYFASYNYIYITFIVVIIDSLILLFLIIYKIKFSVRFFFNCYVVATELLFQEVALIFIFYYKKF